VRSPFDAVQAAGNDNIEHIVIFGLNSETSKESLGSPFFVRPPRSPPAEALFHTRHPTAAGAGANRCQRTCLSVDLSGT